MAKGRIINGLKHNHGADLNIRRKAKDLRKQMTQSEKILWEKLRKSQLGGKYFRRQHPFGIYILDFYCFEAELVIEIDGEIHLARKEYDKERTDYLEASGLKVLRFRNDDIINRISWVMSMIYKYL